jgi:hypothetical protein
MRETRMQNVTYHNTTESVETQGIVFKETGTLYVNGIAMSRFPEKTRIALIPPGCCYWFSGEPYEEYIEGKWVKH